MNIIKRIKFYKYYKSIIDKNREELLQKYNIYVDDIYRLYTVVSSSKEEYDSFGVREEQLFNLSSPEATRILNDSLNDMTKGKIITGDEFLISKTDSHIKMLDNYLIKCQLGELYGLTEKKRLDKYNIRYVVEYKYLNMRLIANLIVMGLFGSIGGAFVAIVYMLIKYFIF